uniref:NTR domain-containing protein n=1 Tax=Haplochromis burtoni TaxID=8153 RepID=A0A3Q2UYP5_HAPBU
MFIHVFIGPCHKLQDTFNRRRRIRKINRVQHACFFPIVDYGVYSKQNIYFLILLLDNDASVSENSVRVFAKRVHCKGKLHLEKQYLIMGKDGTTKDSSGMMQYLLESNTWVEKKPSVECSKSVNKYVCKEFDEFVDEYKVDGCRQ